MALFDFILFWGPIGFAALVGASYLGTKLALRSYFDDEDPPHPVSLVLRTEKVTDKHVSTERLFQN